MKCSDGANPLPGPVGGGTSYANGRSHDAVLCVKVDVYLQCLVMAGDGLGGAEWQFRAPRWQVQSE